MSGAGSGPSRETGEKKQQQPGIADAGVGQVVSVGKRLFQELGERTRRLEAEVQVYQEACVALARHENVEVHAFVEAESGSVGEAGLGVVDQLLEHVDDIDIAMAFFGFGFGGALFMVGGGLVSYWERRYQRSIKREIGKDMVVVLREIEELGERMEELENER